MTPEERIEKNKLIADSPFSKPRLRDSIASDKSNGFSEEYIYGNMKFHSSMEWLHDVILNIGQQEITDNNSLFYVAQQLTDTPVGNSVGYFFDKTVNFIRQYNNYQSKKS